MTEHLHERSSKYPHNLTINDADIQFLLDKSQELDCVELQKLWCMRIANHQEVWRLTRSQRTEFFVEYSAAIAKLIHLTEQGYGLPN